MSARMGLPSSWNTPIESPRRSSSNVGLVVEGDAVDVGAGAGAPLDELQRCGR